jgi:hypothetical protein
MNTYVEEVRRFYRETHNTDEDALPCPMCFFEVEEDTECGYVWITCGAGGDNGCDWGNL